MAPPVKNASKQTLTRSARFRELKMMRGTSELFGTNVNSIPATDNTVEAVVEVSQNVNNSRKFRVLFSVAGGRNPIGNTSIYFNSFQGSVIFDDALVLKNPSTNNYYAFIDLPFPTPTSVSIRKLGSNIFYSTSSSLTIFNTYDDTVEAVLEVSQNTNNPLTFRVLFSVAGGRNPTDNTSITFYSSEEGSATINNVRVKKNLSTTYFNTIYTNNYYAFIDLPFTLTPTSVSIRKLGSDILYSTSSSPLTIFNTYDDTVEAVLEVSKNINNPLKFRVLFSVAGGRDPTGNTTVSFNSFQGGGDFNNVPVVKNLSTTYFNTIYTNNYYAFIDLPYISYPTPTSVSIRKLVSNILYSTSSSFTVNTYDDTPVG
jgi:hypothetical protein